jgi:hypothetical protein
LTPSEALDVTILQQMVTDYFHTLDTQGGLAALHFFSEDVDVAIGNASYSGHAGMRRFYERIRERVKTEQKDGIRTGRHTYLNFKVDFPEPDRATILLVNVTFTGSGAPPVDQSVAPSILTDVRFECRRHGDGQWVIHGYYGKPVFVGSDPFLIKSLIET